MSAVSKSLRASTLAIALALALAGPAHAYVVCVDAGHGGVDPGAVGICYEKAINLSVSNRLLYLLQHDPDFEGSFATRTGDITVSLSQRVAMAEQAGAAAFVSLHHNSGTIVRTFVEYDTAGEQAAFRERSRSLASGAADQLCWSFSAPRGLTCTGECLDQEPACSGVSLYVLRENARPAVLGEPCGVFTATAARLCSTAVYTDYMDEARAYRDALRGFFGLTAIGMSFAASGGPGADTLRWVESDPQRIVVYALSRSDACWGPFEPLASIVSHDERYTGDDAHYTFVDRAVAYARPYWYRIEVAGERNTAFATPGALPPASPPGTPETPSASGFDRGGGRASVSLSWPASPGAVSGYRVYRSLYEPMPACDALFDVIGTAAAAAFVDTTAPVDVPIFYRVRAFNATGGSAISGEAALTVPAQIVAAPKPQSAPGLLAVWPNPARGAPTISLALPHAARVEITLHDVTGRRVATMYDGWCPAGNHVATAILSERIASGLYFVRLRVDNGRLETRRLILIH